MGDQILEVNNQSFLDVTHDEAVSQLKYHKRMSLLVRDVGKVPHSCTAYDHPPGSPGSRISAANSARKWSAALQMVEEKARCVLARSEFASLCYYTDEYAARHMDVEAYVHVVLELLNTPEKVRKLITNYFTITYFVILISSPRQSNLFNFQNATLATVVLSSTCV